jgi:hypothetical protein
MLMPVYVFLLAFTLIPHHHLYMRIRFTFVSAIRYSILINCFARVNVCYHLRVLLTGREFCVL